MIKFSIVVPVYNVESYLPKCVESILSQSYKNYQLILVNDGSTDQSGLICNKFALHHNNIDVIHKKNGGLSDARNVGIANAKGEYIIFIDSDDYIELETLDRFANRLVESDNPDIMITRIMQVYDDLEIKHMDKDMPVELIKNGNKEDVIRWIFNKSDNTWPSVRYVVKNSFVKKNSLKFPDGYLHEDLDWTSRIFLYGNTFTCLDYYWYNHRMERQGSITTKKNPKRTLDVIKLVSKNIRDDRYKIIDIELRNIIFERMLKSLFSSLSDYKFYNDEGRQTIIEALSQNNDIFKYTTEFRHKIFISFCNLFGFKLGLSIMSLVHRV